MFKFTLIIIISILFLLAFVGVFEALTEGWLNPLGPFRLYLLDQLVVKSRKFFPKWLLNIFVSCQKFLKLISMFFFSCLYMFFFCASFISSLFIKGFYIAGYAQNFWAALFETFERDTFYDSVDELVDEYEEKVKLNSKSPNLTRFPDVSSQTQPKNDEKKGSWGSVNLGTPPFQSSFSAFTFRKMNLGRKSSTTSSEFQALKPEDSDKDVKE